MIKVLVVGVGGKMGRTLTQACAEADNATLVAGTEYPESSLLGQDIGVVAGIAANGVSITGSVGDAVSAAEVAIDFTRPLVSLATLEACVNTGCAAVIGTTGFDAEQKAQIDAAAKRIPIVMAANFSVGVNVCLKLLHDAAAALGDDYDVEIIEAHHRHKVDAPSGTALAMGESVADALGRDLADCAVYAREGDTGARDGQTIGFQTIRGGDIVGEHTVMFISTGERVEISHKASSRMNFAAGAVRAAQWVARREPGLYSMQDVLARD